MPYRKRIGSDTWHWRSDCSQWPTGCEGVDYVERWTKPADGELDNECKAKDR